MRTKLVAVLSAAALVLGLTVALPAGAAPAGVATSLNDEFTSYPVSVSGDYIPLVGSCGATFILWYAPGPAQDHLWRFTGAGTQHTSTPVSVNGNYRPVVGDFDGNTCDDIFWYGPGSSPDFVWWNFEDLDIDSRSVTVSGDYQPLVMELDFAGWDDIFWYAPGPAQEYIWEGQIDQTFESDIGPSVSGTYRAAAARREILFHGPGGAADYLWTGVDAGEATPGASIPLTLNGNYQPFTVERSISSIALYGPGAGFDQWMRNVSSPPVDYLPATVNGTYTVGRSSPTVSHRIIVWHAPGPAGDYIWIADS